ncbi:MAG: RluA family pseudouridine synthase [Flavobacteriales bacterium]|nr:RluA family pseudouridine synthase [Flavobacteriales bacterium]
MSNPEAFEILYEDNHLIVVNKMAGEIVQGDRTGDEPLIDKVKRFLKEKYDKPGEVFLGSPHRLDRPTSGIVVFTKTSKALTRMNKLFHDKTIQKTYWAIVKNQPPKPSDHLIHYLRKNHEKNKSMAFDHDFKGAKKAELTYTLIHSFNNYFLLEILPITGRHHQIRVQLSTIGCPIKGDLKYGFPRSNPDASISLHARKIEFIHPVTQEPVSIVADPVSKDPLWLEASKTKA